jgi:hypothetical protein
MSHFFSRVKIHNVLGRSTSLSRRRSKQVFEPSAGSTHVRYFSAFHLSSFNSLEEEIEESGKRYENRISIETTSDRDWGLVACKTFLEGEKVMTAKAVSNVPIRDSHSIQVDWEKHVRIDLPARFINHSCDANCGVQDNEHGAYDFHALNTIPEGEELTFNYETSENEISAFETCMCGSKSCRGYVGGFSKHRDELQGRYGKYIANYLK